MTEAIKINKKVNYKNFCIAAGIAAIVYVIISIVNAILYFFDVYNLVSGHYNLIFGLYNLIIALIPLIPMILFAIYALILPKKKGSILLFFSLTIFACVYYFNSILNLISAISFSDLDLSSRPLEKLYIFSYVINSITYLAIAIIFVLLILSCKNKTKVKTSTYTIILTAFVIFSIAMSIYTTLSQLKIISETPNLSTDFSLVRFLLRIINSLFLPVSFILVFVFCPKDYYKEAVIPKNEIIKDIDFKLSLLKDDYENGNISLSAYKSEKTKLLKKL